MTTSENILFIGGLGGSGTRVVAQIFEGLDLYPGPVLNPSHDNQLFSFLFRRPDWFARLPDDTRFARTLNSFLDETRHGVPGGIAGMTADEIADLRQQIADWPVATGALPAFQDLLLDHCAPDLSVYAGLMCKEPNCHVFLPLLARHLPKMRFVQVVRHGLDMALSGNQKQHRNWGALYDMPPFPDKADPRAHLQFWIRANRQSIATGQTRLGDRFHLLRYDDLCDDPGPHITALARFAGLNLPPETLDALTNLVAPTTHGRWRDAPAGTFTQDDLAQVAELGFDVS